MKALFFEDPFWLYGLLLVAAAVLGTVWWRTRERAHALRLLIPVGLAGVVFAVSTLVVTDREKIQAATEALVSSVKAGRLDAFETYLDRDFRGHFRGRAMNRDQTLQEARQILTQAGVGDVDIKKNDIEVKGPDARQRLQVLVDYHGPGARGRLPVLFQIHWIRTEQGWRIYEVAEPEFRVGF